MFRSILAIILIAATNIHAKEAPAIVCQYPNGETVFFQGAGSVDITNPYRTEDNRPNQSVPLLVNGKGPFLYSLTRHPSRIGTWFTYSIRGDFFINDIEITFLRRFQGAIERAEGSHRTDYTTLRLFCAIKR